MKIFLKRTSVFFVLLLCLTISSCHALDFSSIKEKVDSFESMGNANTIELDASELVNGAANILTTIGVTIVLAGILIIGVKYMVATPEEAAKLKTKLVGLVVAGIVIIGAFGIWTLARTFFEGMAS